MPTSLAALLLALSAGVRQDTAPLLRVTQGQALLAQGREILSLDVNSGAHRLVGRSGWVESRPYSEMELRWPGEASATISGPTSFEFEATPRLHLETFRTAEIEARRGTLVLALAGLGTLDVEVGALQVRSLPNGSVEILNRGASDLTLRRDGEPPVQIPPGRRLRLRPADGE